MQWQQSVSATFGELLRHARTQAGLTQEQLAERAGISVYTITNIERGVRHMPRPVTLNLLAEALGLVEEERTAFWQAARGLVATNQSQQIQPPQQATNSGPATQCDTCMRLPMPPTSLIGRHADLVATQEVLLQPGVRLLTLVGVPGVGKTQLALAVAESAETTFADGSAFISLAPLRDPSQVPGALAAVLGVREQPQQSLLDALRESLWEKHLLLVLDNFEHLMAAAAFVADLLAACPHVKALITSQAPLYIRGEQVCEVAPLAIPPDGAPRPGRTLAGHAKSAADGFFNVKLRVPQVNPSTLPRPHLMDWLDTWTRCSLVVISAPAGSGKTTMLSAWSACSLPHRVAWVSLDAGDNDPSRFWRCVLTAVDTAIPNAGRAALAQLDQSASADLESVVMTFSNTLLATRATDGDRGTCNLVLILDDYHLITAQDIHESLSLLLDHIPPSLHLVLSTRSDPPFSFARLRVSGQVGELRAADLRFTADEIAEFFRLYTGHALTKEETAALESSTEGWIAPLRLAALALDAGHDLADLLRALASGTHSSLVDYLADEVFERQPPPMRDFLLKTSLLRQLCAPLAEAVTGQPDSHALLRRLERANLFLVALDPDRQWYRYHHLFAEFLRNRLRETQPGILTDLHTRAAQWLEQHGMPADAIEHALAAQDFSYAARMMDSAAPPLEESGELSTLLRWTEALPEEYVAAMPRVCLTLAWARLATGPLSTVETRARQAEQALAVAPPASISGMERDELHGKIAAIRGILAFMQGDHKRAAQLSLQALECLPAHRVALRAAVAGPLCDAYAATGDFAAAIQLQQELLRQCQASGNVFAALDCLYQLGSLYMQQANLVEAVRAFRQAVDLASSQPGGPPPVAAHAYLYLARVLFERNDLPGAKQYLATSVELNRHYGDVGLTLRCLLLAGRLHFAEHDQEGLEGVIADIERLRSQPGSRIARLAATSETRLWLLVGNLATVDRWVSECGLTVDDPMSPTQEYAHLVFARCLSAQGRLDEAVLLLGRLAAAAEAGNRTEKAIEIVMCQAVALYHLGKTAQALDELRHALALAEPGDYARVFIDEGAPMLALLGKLAHSQDAQEHMRRPSAHYVRQLLSFGWSDILSGPPRSSKAPFCLDRTPHQPPRSSRTP